MSSDDDAKAGAAGATWDGQVVEELRSLGGPGEPDLVAELVQTFRDEGVPCLARIMDGLSRADAADIGRAAHKLKGGALNLGATRLARAAAELERAARTGDAASLAPLAASVRSEWDRFLARAAAATAAS